MSQLGVILQESLQREGEERTILGLLTEQMESVNRDHHSDREPRRRRSLKERLRFTGMGCCGATWGFRPTSVSHDGGGEEDERRQQRQRLQETNLGQRSSSSDPDCLSPNPSGSGMNLAAALVAERQFRGTQEPETERQGTAGSNLRRRGVGVAPGTPWRVSLMRLLEEGEGVDSDCDGERRCGERYGVLRVHGKEERSGIYPMWAYFLQGVLQRVVAQPRDLSPLQPFDPRDSRHLLKFLAIYFFPFGIP